MTTRTEEHRQGGRRQGDRRRIALTLDELAQRQHTERRRLEQRIADRQSPRRKHLRIAVLEGDLAAAWPPKHDVPLTMINLSVSGVALVSPEPLGELDEVIDLHLRSCADANWREAPCRLRFVIADQLSQITRWLHGADFVHLPDETWTLVQGYVDSRS